MHKAMFDIKLGAQNNEKPSILILINSYYAIVLYVKPLVNMSVSDGMIN